MYKVIKPEVKLLGGFNSIADAWKASRPHLSEKDAQLHILDKLDLPVQGFAQFAFHIKGSLAFRELLYLLRPSQCWAQSMRTIDLKEEHLFISEEVPFDQRSSIGMKFNEFLFQKRQGTPQDECKSTLPPGMITEYSISLDVRTLANVYKGLKRLSPTLFMYYMVPMAEQLREHGVDLANFPGRDFIIEDLMVSNDERKIFEEGADTVRKMGRMNIVGGKMQMVLAAQAIRKQYDKVYSDIVPAILDGSIYDKYQTEEYLTVMYLPDVSYKSMQSTRTCFFAKYDHEDTASWSSILASNIKNLTPTEFRAQLPCKGSCKLCPYRAEQLARIIAGNTEDYDSVGEVNPPCPILVGNQNTQKLREHIFKSDSVIHQKWTEMLEEYPETELTEDGEAYMRNINEHGFASDYDNKPGIKETLLTIVNKGVTR